MKVLVVGGGGREHTIIKKIKENKRVETIYALPGNAGIAKLAECVPIGTTEIKKIRDFAVEHQIDFAVVAPDDPLVLGCTDLLKKEGIPVFGPNKKAAVIEGSKAFSKDFMQKYRIPTARYQTCSDYKTALDYVQKNNQYPIVIKADGLALGKGVIIAESFEKAKSALQRIMIDKTFGDSGNQVVIEEFLEGPEITILAFCDGKTVKPMLSSMDHKKIHDNDQGENTGGMGVILPNPFYTEEVAENTMKEIILPTVRGLEQEERPFKGCLYFGLMLTPEGVKVIEYNCRFGDPEAQTVLSMLETDLLEIMQAVANESLDKIEIRFKQGAACCVVAASGGYPKSYEKGKEISLNNMKGERLCNEKESLTIFHAGTAEANGKLVTNGGRVLNIVATSDCLEHAVDLAYRAIKTVSFEQMYYRKDIGKKALEALSNRERAHFS